VERTYLVLIIEAVRSVEEVVTVVLVLAHSGEPVLVQARHGEACGRNDEIKRKREDHAKLKNASRL